ncbi:short-chain dehydrogenase [Fusarium tjaetaba]|uniref:Short-chain dehydrogenase n=1 Tax=Fusarium tjaetaba TaxID=1567544 RepID=A0A8H5S6Y9_9HYPO|nr:short-chain dehydrogenase [Fusarium tjaetaba]KAF5646497.1 short-chain dehydrogenase [Fusarium tjaetaba]
MVAFKDIRASNSRITADVAPSVVVSVGGTAGIGKATLIQLVSLGLPIKVYVLGRNGATQKPFIDRLRQSNPRAEVVWLEGQISLLAETSRLCNEIKAREEKVDLILLSTGFLPMGPRQETSEGIEKASAVGYYSRMLIITQLLPLLSAAAADPSRTYTPRVVNICAAGRESSDIFLDDLALKAPGHFGLVSYLKHVGTMTTLTMRKLAEDPANKDIVMIHHFPGGVGTDLMKNRDSRAGGWLDNWVGTVLMGIAARVLKLLSTTAEQAGERCLYLSTSAAYGGKGVLPNDSQESVLTLSRTPSGSLFSIGETLEPAWNDKVLDELQNKQAPEIVWRWTEGILRPYK